MINHQYKKENKPQGQAKRSIGLTGIALTTAVGLLVLQGCSMNENIKVPANTTVNNQQVDNATLAKDWVLTGLNNKTFNNSISAPTMTIDTKNSRIFGNNGCNQFNTTIDGISSTSITLGSIASTRMACPQPSIDQDFNQAISKTSKYNLNNDRLTFLSSGNEPLLTFTAKDNQAQHQLYDIWAVTHVLQKKVDTNDEMPRLEFNLNEMTVYGSDGCNNFSGQISSINSNSIELGNIAVTQRLCSDTKTPNGFYNALNAVSAYAINGLDLTLMDNTNNNVMKLRKVD